jgi:hypothetical protein
MALARVADAAVVENEETATRTAEEFIAITIVAVTILPLQFHKHFPTASPLAWEGETVGDTTTGDTGS